MTEYVHSNRGGRMDATGMAGAAMPSGQRLRELGNALDLLAFLALDRFRAALSGLRADAGSRMGTRR